MRKGILCLALLTVAWAAGKSHTITLFDPAVVAGKKLPAGQYKLEVRGDKAVISNRDQTVESPVKAIDSDRKYSSTTVRYDNQGGANTIQEIRIGGTKTRLVFERTETPMAGREHTHATP